MLPFKHESVLEIASEGALMGQHIRVCPTRLFNMMLLLSFAIWVAAANYQVNIAYAICFWVWGFIFIAFLMTWRQLLGLHIKITFDNEVFAGQKAQVKLQWSSAQKHRIRLFWWRSASHFNDEGNEESVWQGADVVGMAETTWFVPIEQRGYFPHPLILILASSAPFGLFHAQAQVEWLPEAVAFAAPLAHENFGQSGLYDPEQAAQQASSYGEDIAFLKPHIEGTSLQHISWKVYAKRGELMDKMFDEPQSILHNEVISYEDYPLSTPPDKLAGLLTYRVLQAEHIGALYTLILPQQTITPQNGMRNKCLNALALM